MVTQYIVSNDGTRIAYDITGHGPALMLLHGAGKTRRDWHKAGYVERLKDDFTVLTVDVRGTGESDVLIDLADYSIEKICDDLNLVTEACGIEHFLVWGYSFGGNIARYLGAWSNRVEAAAVIGIPVGLAVDHEFDTLINEFVAKWQPLAEAYKTGAATEKEKRSVIKSRIPVWVACFQAMRTWPKILPEDMRCPTLLLAGTKNQGARKWVEANQAALSNTMVEVKIINGLNHSQEFSKIEQVFPVVSAFFSRHVPAM
jgi:pimeloyl-ACP methyl ester carboxylesterase